MNRVLTGKAFTVELGGQETCRRLEKALTGDSPLLLIAHGKTNECGGAGSLLTELLKHRFPVTGLLDGKACGESATLLLACDGIFWRKGGGLQFNLTGNGEITLLKKRLGREAARRVLFSSAGKLTRREALASGWAREAGGSLNEAISRVSAQYEELSSQALSIMKELLYHEDGLTLSGGETLERAAFALVFSAGNPEALIESFREKRRKAKNG